MTTPTIRRPLRGVFYTSDLHLFHDKVARTRGFPDHPSHDRHMAQVWDANVHPAAQVWVLGDLTGGGRTEDALDWIAERPGEKHLVLGNHDEGHPLHRDSHRKVRRYFRVFHSVQLHASRRINGRRVLASHFPYTGDHSGEDRHPQWRLPNRGHPLLHGHTHQGQVSLFNDNVIHVGWDTWFRPVHTDEIAELIH